MLSAATIKPDIKLTEHAESLVPTGPNPARTKSSGGTAPSSITVEAIKGEIKCE